MPGSNGLRILEFEKKKPSELRFGLGRSKSIFGTHRGQTSSLRQRQHVVGSDGKVSIERNCVSLSLLMSKNLKLKKVIKSFIPEPISCISGSPMYISRIHILVYIFGREYITGIHKCSYHKHTYSSIYKVVNSQMGNFLTYFLMAKTSTANG